MQYLYTNSRYYTILFLVLFLLQTSLAQWQFVHNISQTQENQANHPGIRYSHAIGFSKNKMIISHGYYYNRGNNAPRWLSDTWTMDLVAPYSWQIIHKHVDEQEATKQYQNNLNLTQPAGRFGASGTVLNEKYFYLFGGTDGGYYRLGKRGYELGFETNEMWRLDLESLQWELLKQEGVSEVGGRHLHAMAAMDGIIYVCGGIGKHKGDLWAFDTSTNQWTLLASEDQGPGSRVGSRMVAVKLKSGVRGLLLFGGRVLQENSKQAIMPNDLWWFDIHDKKWTTLQINSQEKPSGRIYYGMSTDINSNDGIVYVVGGSTSGPSMNCTSETWAFSLNCEGSGGQWTRLYDLPFGHYYLSALANKGEIFTFGGHVCSFTKGDLPYYYLNQVLKLDVGGLTDQLQLMDKVV
eukprot:TRINITY_DN1746_c1_g1_i1.p1 TRINITY_DN1746_c1_g1~~TRINITY_DN1746_c1_g1_i1.p1  ORF type:complete len:419 (-),score=28.99 TRINITY_DN1746_c1_g1_i1:647-1867(-)